MLIIEIKCEQGKIQRSLIIPESLDEGELRNAALLSQAAAEGTTSLCGQCINGCDWMRICENSLEQNINLLKTIISMSQNHTES